MGGSGTRKNVQQDIAVHSFAATLVVAKRKSDGQMGSLYFFTAQAPTLLTRWVNLLTDKKLELVFSE